MRIIFIKLILLDIINIILSFVNELHKIIFIGFNFDRILERF